MPQTTHRKEAASQPGPLPASSQQHRRLASPTQQLARVLPAITTSSSTHPHQGNSTTINLHLQGQQKSTTMTTFLPHRQQPFSLPLLLLLLSLLHFVQISQAFLITAPSASATSLLHATTTTRKHLTATDMTCIAVSRRRQVHPLSPLFAAAEEGSDGEEDGATDEEDASADALVSNLKGKHRRALRSLAGRKKNDKSLFTMQQAETPPTAPFRAEMESALRAHELVNVRVLFAQKKKEAKVVGEAMARAVSAELVQVIGHTYLLYKAGTPPKIDLEKLIGPAEGGAAK